MAQGDSTEGGSTHLEPLTHVAPGGQQLTPQSTGFFGSLHANGEVIAVHIPFTHVVLAGQQPPLHGSGMSAGQTPGSGETATALMRTVGLVSLKMRFSRR